LNFKAQEIRNENVKTMFSPRIIIPCFLFQFSIFYSGAQTNELSEAAELFTGQHFSSAIQIYQSLLKKDPAKPDLNYKIGVCYLQSRSQKNKAIYYFQKATEGDSARSTNVSDKNTEPIIYKLLGEAYSYADDYDRAIASYKKYKEALMLNIKSINNI
jgi:tetratricopeptide (TPR) repeat protein